MDQKHYDMMNWEEVESVIYADCDNPFSVLGVHKKGKSKLIQIFYPGADEIEVVFICDNKKKLLKLEKVDEAGFFAEFFSFEYSSYTYNVKINDTYINNVSDPYCFVPSFDLNELKNILKGKSSDSYRFFGSHKKEINGITGYEFLVYAPNAICVSLVGDFNSWNECANLMQSDSKHNGLFALFVPNLSDYSEYRYVIKAKGYKEYKLDPYSLGYKNGNSLTLNIEDSYDNSKNKCENPHILEIDILNLFKNAGNKEAVLKQIEELLNDGLYNTASFINLHAKEEDNALNLFSLDLSNVSFEDLKFVFDELKKKKYILLFEISIAKFSNNRNGLRNFDSTCIYENEDYRQNYHKFYNALLPDYGKGITRSYCMSSVNCLLSVLPFDGINISDVGITVYHDYNKKPGEYITENWDSTVNSSGVAILKDINEFIHTKYVNAVSVAGVYAYFDNVTGKGKNNLGFDYCLNTGYTNQILDFFSTDFYRRKDNLDSFLLFTAEDNNKENYIYPFSYRELSGISRIYDFSGNEVEGLSNLKSAYLYKNLIDGAQLSNIGIIELFNGNAVQKKQFLKFVKDFEKFGTDNKVLFENSDGNNYLKYKCKDNLVVSKEFFQKNDKYLVIYNFSGESFKEFKITVSKEGVYSECFNTDTSAYGGLGMKNIKSVETLDKPGEEITLSVKIPALSAVIYSYREFTEAELEERYQKKKAEMIAYVEGEKKKINEKLNSDIIELKAKANSEIIELEKLLKPYDR